MWKRYKNFSARARLLAWLIDLITAPAYRIFAFFHPVTASASGARKILLVRLDHIGDLLMATPAISALRRKLPHARIDLLGGDAAKLVFRGNGDIDRIHTFDATWYDPRRGRELWPVDVVSTVLRLRRERYDAAVDMRGDFRVSFLFLWLTGAGRRIGFKDLGLDFLLTDAVDFSPEKNHIDLNFDALSPFGIDRSDRRTRFFVSADDESFIDELFRENGMQKDDRFVGINPTTNRVEQRWDEKKFAEVADRLIESFNVKVILVSAPADAAVVGLMENQMRHQALNLSGKTTLGQLGALMKRLHLYMANDSGSLHLSISLRTPTLGIFGSTNPEKAWSYEVHSPLFRPVTSEVDCVRPCYTRDCEDRKCFDLITVDQVYSVASDILKARLSLNGPLSSDGRGQRSEKQIDLPSQGK